MYDRLTRRIVDVLPPEEARAWHVAFSEQTTAWHSAYQHEGRTYRLTADLGQ
jgi:hypothetical protein